jgi:hypothetical protein
VPTAQFGEKPEELAPLHQQPRVGGHGLDDRRGDLVALLREGSLERRLVVERHDRGECGELGRDSGRGGDAEGREPRAGVDEQRIAVAVVATGELEDP